MGEFLCEPTDPFLVGTLVVKVIDAAGKPVARASVGVADSLETALRKG